MMTTNVFLFLKATQFLLSQYDFLIGSLRTKTHPHSALSLPFLQGVPGLVAAEEGAGRPQCWWARTTHCSACRSFSRSPGRAPGPELTSVVVDAVQLHQRHTDGTLGSWVILLTVGVVLPAGTLPLLLEALAAPLAMGVVSSMVLAAEHRHPVDAVVADLIVDEVREAGGHHPHAAALVACSAGQYSDSAVLKTPSPAPKRLVVHMQGRWDRGDPPL